MTGFFLFIPIKFFSILLSVGIAAGFYCFLLGFRLLARKNSLLTTPTAKIRSATRGLVEVSGRAAGPCTMLAPITGEPCFLYHTTVWQQHEGKEKQWDKVVDETLHRPFFIDDSTGQLLVEARGADLELHPRFRGKYPSLLQPDDIPVGVSRFLSRHGITLDRNLRIEERLIKADDAFFVAGTLADNPGIQARPFSPHSDAGIDPHNPIRDTMPNTVRNSDRRNPAPTDSSKSLPAPEVIRLASGETPSSTREMSQQAKIAAALTRAGATGPQAWSIADHPPHTLAVKEAEAPATLSSRSEVRLHEVRLGEAHPDGDRLNKDRPDEDRPDEDQPNSSDFNLIPPVVLMKGKNDPTLVISFRSPKEIVSATAWKAAAMVGGGTAIALFGLYMLWAQMGSQ